MPSKQIESYLAAKLKKILGHDYRVFVRLSTSKNQFKITIDESTMSLKSYKAIYQFMRDHDLKEDLAVFSQVLKLQYGEDYRFQYAVLDLDGVYVIREKMVPTESEEMVG